jgi:hypothetical protein
LENEYASNYRTFRLKARLQERFPHLVFHTPKVRNRSEIVYAEDISRGNVAEMILTTEEQSDSDETENDEIGELIQDTSRKNEMVPN